MEREGGGRNMPPLRPFERQLFLAAHSGDVNALRRIVVEHKEEDDITVNVTDECNWTPLTIAILQGHRDAVQALVALGADVVNGAIGRVPAQVACEEGHLEILTYLIEQGVDPVKQGILHTAAVQGHVPILQWLVHVYGVPIDAHDKNTKGTALHLASKWLQDEVLRWLLINGASPCARDRKNKTPLHRAVANKCSTRAAASLSVVRQLVQASGVDGMACQDSHGRTALHEATIRGKKEVAMILMRAGADILIADCLGHSPLFEAGCSNADLLQAMLEHLQQQNGYSQEQIQEAVNRTDCQGWTCLHHAIFCGELEVVECLLAHGASVEPLVTPRQQHTLHLVGSNLAIKRAPRGKDPCRPWQEQYQEVAKWLLSYGKWFIWCAAVTNGYPQAKIPPLPRLQGLEACFDVRPITNGGTAMSKLLLDKGANALVYDEDGNLPFFLSAATGNVCEVFLMLRAAAHEGLFRNLGKHRCIRDTAESNDQHHARATTVISKRPFNSLFIPSSNSKCPKLPSTDSP